jgi:hypothetical protein
MKRRTAVHIARKGRWVCPVCHKEKHRKDFKIGSNTRPMYCLKCEETNPAGILALYPPCHCAQCREELRHNANSLPL